ncbi:hypothetical protein N6H18_18395 [Reichenbachiella agarivorans]|uniref:Uncharacterized protein n=1 Tax=Reichenbachiella agarivorans TaxID=2979464 RepID=A0ABY6CP55_9BACT|nr:hypothetical protein [Reichenbachiella agarivorans]UXP32312.1 hypothetical protein N6H18_18395 [Reichenbachiella agarivorans]
MAIRFKNGEEYYNKIYTLFNLSVAVTLLPFGYLVLEKHSGSLVSMPLDSWLLWSISLPSLAALGYLVYWSHQSFIADKASAKTQPNLRAKLQAFHTLLLKRFLTYTGISGACTLLLFITGSGLFIMAYVVTMILLSLSRPTLNLIIEALDLAEEEEKILIDKLDIQ